MSTSFHSLQDSSKPSVPLVVMSSAALWWRTGRCKVCYSWLRRFNRSPTQPTKVKNVAERWIDLIFSFPLPPTPHCDWFASNPCAVAAACSLQSTSGIEWASELGRLSVSGQSKRFLMKRRLLCQISHPIWPCLNKEALTAAAKRRNESASFW